MSSDGFVTPPATSPRKSPPPIKRRTTDYIAPATPAEYPPNLSLGPSMPVLVLPPKASGSGTWSSISWK